MMHAVRVGAFLAAALGVAAGQAAAQELKVGDQAPDFTLQASDGQTYSLSKLRGRTVVLAWFPKAFTAG
jgi:peroxiredoxin Q/BCP